MKKQKILIVDDTPANLWLLTKMLQQDGYVVRPVTSGAMALKSAKSNPPDLVLLDIIMPGMDGYEVCAAFKNNESLRDIPIIFLTAMSDSIDKVKAFAIGAVDYITKPFEPKEVQARISTHITICTQKKMLKDSLEHKYRNLFENAINGIFQFNEDGQILNVNPAYALTYGYGSPEEMLAEVKNLGDKIFVSRDEFESFMGILTGQGSIFKYEMTSRRRTGETIWVTINARAVRSPEGRNLYFDGFLDDITQKKLSEDNLRRSEAEMRALIESMNDVVLAFNADGICVKAPQTKANYAFKPPEGFVGRKLQEIFPGISKDECLNKIRNALETREPVSMEYFLDMGNQEHWFYAVITPMPDDTALWVARNITDIKETNIALKVLLKNVEESKKETESNICDSFKSLVLPYLQNIKRLKLSDAQLRYMETVEKNIGGIVSQFTKELKQYNLTPTEMEIANYTRDGRSSKEIAEIMHISKGVVDIHRYRIRKKLGINNEKANLRTFLLDLKP